MLTLDIIEQEISNVITHGNNRADIEFLANLYICRAEMQGKDIFNAVYPAALESDTEFAKTIKGKSTGEVLAVMDELMTAVQVTNPRLYSSAIQKLREG